MPLVPRLPLLLASLLVLSACGREPAAEPAAVDTTAAAPAGPVAPAEPRVDPAAVRGEIEAANRRLAEALSQGDVAGFVQGYATDARILPPEMAPAEGRESIQQFWAGSVERLGIGGVQLATDEVGVFGDTAYEQGRYRFDTNQGPAQGKYLAIWKRTPEGWQWHRVIWNPSPGG